MATAKAHFLSLSPSPIILLLLFLHSFPIQSKCQPQTPQQKEQRILLKLKTEWKNPPLLSHWTTESNGDHCSWPEIYCTADGTITEIDLSSMGLSYPIPSSICDLTSLTKIDLSGNNVPGPFPIYLSNCSNLQYLNISWNPFAGTLPSDINRLSSLRYVNLSANGFDGEIPPAICRMSNLIELQLDYNSFIGSVPSEIGRLKSLKKLQIGNSYLTGEIPGSLTNLTNLEQLDLSGNKLSGWIPRDLFRLKNLKRVYLSNNNLSGEIPRPIDALVGLEYLDLSMNQLTGTIPEDFGKLVNLESLFLQSNRISGEIPATLTALAQLYTLDLEENRISGEIPWNIISWKYLNTLNLAKNQLTGRIPPAIGSLLSLHRLELSENQLSGEIPPELDNLNRDGDRLGTSFLGNSRLCASNSHPFTNVRSCDSHKISLRALASILATRAFLVLAFLAWFVLFQNYKKREMREQRQEQDITTTWKLISFQRLDFTEDDILNGLVESNLIGSGRCGKVYRISVGNQRDDLVVAVKKICNSNKSDAKLEKEFQAEIDILGLIRHANIVKLLCCISSQASKLLVYEYMENGSLDRWLYQKRNGTVEPYKLVSELFGVIGGDSTDRISEGFDWRRAIWAFSNLGVFFSSLFFSGWAPLAVKTAGVVPAAVAA